MTRRRTPIYADQVDRARQLGRLPGRGRDEISVDDHREIGRLLAHTSETLTHLFVRVANTHGKRARVTRLARAADRAVDALRAELEELLFASALDSGLTEAEREAAQLLRIYFAPPSRTGT